MFKVIGYQHSAGSFVDERSGEVIPYDNCVFHLISDTDPNVIGQSAIQQKFKSEIAPKAVGTTDYSSLIGKSVSLVTGIVGKKIAVIGLEVVEDGNRNNSKH